MKRLFTFEEVNKKEEKETIYRFILKQPSRQDREDIDIQYAAYLSKMISLGLLTKAGLVQYDENTGGVLSKSNAKKINDLYWKFAQKSNEVTKAELEPKTPANDEKLAKLYAEIAEIKKEVLDFESFHNSVFENCAEVKARNKTIEYAALQLTYLEIDGGQEAPLFLGDTIQEKLEYLDSVDETNEALMRGIQKCFAFWTFWYMGVASKPEDFESLINEVDKEQEEEAKAQEEAEAETKVEIQEEKEIKT